MRRREKIYCDRCGDFIRDLFVEELRKIDQERFKGSKMDREEYCNKCIKRKNGN